MVKLNVIPNKNYEIVEIYKRVLLKELLKENKDNKKIVFLCFNLVNKIRQPSYRKKNYHDLKMIYAKEIIEIGKIGLFYCEKLTPNEIMNIFPTNKCYDGKRWESKDWFYVQEMLKQYNCDAPIGDNALEFLFNTYNHKISSFIATYLSCVDTININDGYTGIFESFFEEIDVHLDKWIKDEKNSVLYNTTTNEVIDFKKENPFIVYHDKDHTK